MAIKNEQQYVRINPDKIFDCNGFIPVLSYLSEADRIKEKNGEKLIGLSVPRATIINLKFNSWLVATDDKSVIENIITAMYDQIKTDKIKKTVVTYVDTEPYKDYLDC